MEDLVHVSVDMPRALRDAAHQAYGSRGLGPVVRKLVEEDIRKAKKGKREIRSRD